MPPAVDKVERLIISGTEIIKTPSEKHPEGRRAGAARARREARGARREVRAALAAAVARAAAVTERGREGGGEQDTRARCAVAVLPHMPADSADGW